MFFLHEYIKRLPEVLRTSLRIEVVVQRHSLPEAAIYVSSNHLG